MKSHVKFSSPFITIAGLLAEPGDAANRGGVAPNPGGGARMLAAQGAPANLGGVAPNVGGVAGMLVAPGLAPAHPIFNIEEGLKGPPLRKSEVGSFFK